MTSRHRREQHNFNLDAPLRSPNERNASADESEEGVPPAAQGQAPADAVGKIEVSPRAISHLASRAAQSCYGVVGLASKHARPGWAELLRREDEHKGVEIAFSAEHVVVDLYVVIEYGTRISEVARNVMSSVKFAVASALGISSVQVNVNVQGIRVSSEA